MKVRTWGYLVREACQGVRHNAPLSLAAVLTIFLSLVALSLVIILGANLRYMAETVRSQVEVVAYLKDDFDRAHAGELLDKVRAIEGVAEVQFVTREEALERLRRMFGERADLLEAVEEDNPLRDEIDVRVPDPSRVDAVAAALRSLSGVAEVSYQRETVRRLDAVTRAVAMTGSALVVLFGAGTVLMVANAVRVSVFARRREIAIMKLVGATDAFIRWPFFLEGALLGLAGAVLTVAVAWFGYGWVSGRVGELLPFVPLVPRQPFLSQLARGILLSGVLIGGTGAVFSVRRHLRV
ncbi:MAG: ABC transporter permease [Clostridia bacterium]|nr:ABC transporter permease [Clostridia bacterium]